MLAPEGDSPFRTSLRQLSPISILNTTLVAIKSLPSQ